MTERKLSLGRRDTLPVTQVHTLVLGSGAAGLNAAVQLRNEGVEDVLIVTEGLRCGTSINTGSDKQTYYKLDLGGGVPDSARAMAAALWGGGGMHGDLAMVEAAGSARAFFHLVCLGVRFPQDRYGRWFGYRTDHDPARRGTSTGPYTSRDMCLALQAEVRRRGIPVRERHHAARLLTLGEGRRRRVCGLLALTGRGETVAFAAENIVFAAGGPGALHEASVYPASQCGAIGLALRAGALAQGLPEWQHGLASVRFRWNVSGTYWQVVPRVVSTAADGRSDPREFLREFLPEAGRLHDLVFLKGYQWPFDAARVAGGSSLLDLLVHRECVERGRRVFLDYRTNPADFAPDALGEEARGYLGRSGARQATPLQRLLHMNPAAVGLYRRHGIDLAREPLEIALCAQHNNGGLAADLWWESVNLRHLFPVGEANGSHGVARPGGAALNAGQVGGFRAAECIAHADPGPTYAWRDFCGAAREGFEDLRAFLDRCAGARTGWRDFRSELQRRMTRHGSSFRSVCGLRTAVREARQQIERLETEGCRAVRPAQAVQALRNRHLCFAHWVYLAAALHHAQSGAGSRGSMLLLDPAGLSAHPRLDPEAWRFRPGNPDFRERVQETVFRGGRLAHRWVPRRPLPEDEAWFETAWAAFRAGERFR